MILWSWYVRLLKSITLIYCFIIINILFTNGTRANDYFVQLSESKYFNF